MAKATKDPAMSAQLWQQHLAASGAKITASVNALSVSPGQLAAAQKATWLANVTAAADRWASSLQNMPLDYWKNAVLTKGIARIQQGAQTAMPKVQAFLTAWLPFMSQTVANLPPRGGLEANIQRMEQLVRAAAQAKGKYRQTGRSR